jgi:signal peptidase I
MIVVLLVIAVALVPRFVGQFATIKGDSMQPTLRDGQHVLVDKITYRLRPPRRGELVITSDPNGSGSIVKRVVAIGGDSIGIEDGLLVLNGVVVAEPYADQHDMDGYFHGPIAVPRCSVFLLGDNRATSIDSRSFGPVPVGAVDGRVTVLP